MDELDAKLEQLGEAIESHVTDPVTEKLDMIDEALDRMGVDDGLVYHTAIHNGRTKYFYRGTWHDDPPKWLTRWDHSQHWCNRCGRLDCKEHDG